MLFDHKVLIAGVILALYAVNGAEDEQSPNIGADKILIPMDLGKGNQLVQTSYDRGSPSFSLPPTHPLATSMRNMVLSESASSSREESEERSEGEEWTRDSVDAHYEPRTEYTPRGSADMTAEKELSVTHSEDAEQDGPTLRHEFQSPKPPPTLPRVSMLPNIGIAPPHFSVRSDAQSPAMTWQATALSIPSDTDSLNGDGQTPNLDVGTITIRSTTVLTVDDTSFIENSEEGIFFPLDGSPVEGNEKKRQRLAKITTPQESPAAVMDRLRRSDVAQSRVLTSDSQG